MKVVDRIGLGTVQFGLDYGISNLSGQVPFDLVVRIVDAYIQQSAHPLFDTAQAYGNSEEVLGRAFLELGSGQHRIISKFKHPAGPGDLRSALESSLNHLKQDHLYGYMAHDASDLINHPEVVEGLKDLSAEGLFQKIGVSAYYPKQILELWERAIDIELVQIPYNLFDRRFDRVLEECHKRGIEVHSRSVYMQGLVFRPGELIEGYFQEFRGPVLLAHEVADRHSRTLAQTALSVPLTNPNIDRVIIGVDSLENLESVVHIEAGEEEFQQLADDLSACKMENEEILLPFNWPKR